MILSLQLFFDFKIKIKKKICSGQDGLGTFPCSLQLSIIINHQQNSEAMKGALWKVGRERQAGSGSWDYRNNTAVGCLLPPFLLPTQQKKETQAWHFQTLNLATQGSPGGLMSSPDQTVDPLTTAGDPDSTGKGLRLGTSLKASK